MGRFSELALAIAAGCLYYQVVMSPPVGLADNGDFGRVLGPFRIEPLDPTDPDRFFRHVVLKYHRNPSLPFFFESVTSEHLLVLAAVAANAVISKDGTLDVRLIGVVHALLLLGSLALILPVIETLPGRVRVAIAALVLLAACDVVYVQYFNSFYSDAGAFLFLLLTIAAALRLCVDTAGAEKNFAICACCAVLFALSKSQHSLVALGILPVLWLGNPTIRLRPRIVATTAILIAAVIPIATVPQSYRATAFYNVVFAGILPQSAEPTLALQELGLNPSFANLSGTNAYSPQSGMQSNYVRDDVARQASFGRLLRYYARHPKVAANLVGAAVTSATGQRTAGFANFPKQSGMPPSFASRSFTVWSSLKKWVFHNRPILFLATVSAAVLLLMALATTRGQLAGVLGLVAAAITALLIGSLADVLDSLRHLHIFTTMCDVLLLTAIGALLTAIFSGSLARLRARFLLR